MTEREQWLELAARCEKAAGPDREISQDLLVLLHPERYAKAENSTIVENIAGRGLKPVYFPHYPPKFTASLDAITALIEKELPVEWLRQDAWAGKPKTC